ncbi:isoprenoid synthase domain-containing protein [Suillus clintonianus]|uniref:isoprenoid synthase domain-containing protein n=1 Tax=Suillus clintonianus TaxID=1904413 RepID=UPI001B86EC35|nr:isoprenoid synthase domain-containing protein [Suillus clintonianus]KAG2156378.1 isoprenoid synthase domain-containing protein [Suillus clintonianus]
MPLGIYQLPDLLSICPKKTGHIVSPSFEETKHSYEQWVRDNIGYFAAIKFAKIQMPLLAALICPKGGFRDLRAILDCMSMQYILEELTDRCSSEAAKSQCDLWIEILKNPEAGEGHRHPFIKLIAKQMVTRMKDAVDPYHWPQFIQSCDEYAKNTAQEALDRETLKDASATRRVAAYMIMRRESIGVRPSLVVMRSIRKLYLPEHVLKHHVVAEMENTALDMVYITNDIYSFKKELNEDGALNNIINIIQKDPKTQHLDLQARIIHAGELFQGALDRFKACRDSLPSFGNDETDKQVAAYADGLVDWVVGNVEWSVVTPRYRVFANDADRRNNILRLDDRWFMSWKFQLLLLISIVIACISLATL